jgi:1,4-dihydroxy-2-naphthoate octaprenyltransferase
MFANFAPMSSTKAWIKAFRLRTLPLALSSIALGSFLAAFETKFNWIVFILAFTTTLFLQVLSNLANDYGDSVSGADNDERVGPERAVQSGLISLSQMKKMMIVFVGLSLFSGVWLIYEGTKGLDLWYVFGFLGLGIAAIGAAIKYTVGKNPYGYMGLGDLFVYLFFGLTGVMGTYYLHTHTFDWLILLPASSLGLLAAGVLNLNNMRDRESDSNAGKRTLVVYIGAKAAKVYHLFLIIGSMLLAATFTYLQFESWFQLLFLVAVPLLILNIRAVVANSNPAALDPQLKQLALTTLLFAIMFGLGLIL